MSRKRKKHQRVTLDMSYERDGDNRLIQRADVAEILYNTLKKVAPEDIDGIQRAYVNISDNEAEIYTPDSASNVTAAAYYGIEPVAVADLDEPFPLISSYGGPPEFDSGKKKFHRNMIRQLLSKIVDEA